MTTGPSALLGYGAGGLFETTTKEMAMDVSFDFNLGECVLILETGVGGRVKALMIDIDNVHWASVQYFDTNKARHTDWFRRDEVTSP